MAYQNRHSQRYLAHLSQDSTALYNEGFEPLLRYVDANANLYERIGYSVTLKQDPVRFAQVPMVHFHASSFSEVVKQSESGLYKLKNVYLGMFGINGALPLHITEFAIDRAYRHNDKTLIEFCDIFHHRFLSLFYRAWAESQPAVSHDRPEKDTFGYRIASFTGPSYEQKSKQKNKHTYSAIDNVNSSLADEKRYLAGLLSIKNKSTGSLAQTLSEYLQQEVKIKTFEGQWYDLPKDCLSKLGMQSVRLGQDCVIGKQTFQRGFNYSILVGPLPYQHYMELVCNQQHFKNMKKLAIQQVGLEFSFSIKLLLNQSDIQRSVLGKSSLGTDAWLSCQQNSLGTFQTNTKEQTAVVAYQYAC